MQETQVWSLGWEDPLEEEMATHSSILVWKIPRTEEPGRLQSMVLQRVGHSWVTKHIYHFCCRPDRYWRQPGRLVHVCVTLVALEGPGVCRRVVSVGVCHPREASLATLASVCCPFIEKSHYWGDQDEIPLFPSKCLLTGLCWILSHWETVPLITSWLHIFLDFQRLKKFLLTWTIFKVFIEFVTVFLLVYVLVFWPTGMWDLSTLTWDQTHTPCLERQGLKVSLDHQGNPSVIFLKSHCNTLQFKMSLSM